VDVPSGRLAVEVDVALDGSVGEVRMTNVPSWVSALDLDVDLGAGGVRVDVAYGGAFYAVAPAAAVGARVRAADLPELVRHGRRIQAALAGHDAVTHPGDARLSGCYGVIWTEAVEDRPRLRQRNVTVFADGEVDRSPCGSGTSARLAVLDRRGALRRGDVLIHEGIVGTTFTGRVVGETDGGVVTEIGGRAFRTGYHTFVLDRRDPLGVGFQLR
jgi:proline racemase/trans-L-3-hydroxyproline dehydratase